MHELVGLSHKQGDLVAVISASDSALPNSAVGGLAPETGKQILPTNTSDTSCALIFLRGIMVNNFMKGVGVQSNYLYCHHGHSLYPL